MVTRDDLESLLAHVEALRERLQALLAELRAEEREPLGPPGVPPRLTRLR